MSNIEKYPKCDMRTSLGNCDPIGGFCTSVNTTICEALHKVAKSKMGEWIKIPEFCGDDVSGFIDNHFSCSECKKEAEINSWGFYILSDFCPNCGAYMRKESEEDYDYERAVDQKEHDILYEPTYNPEDDSM